MIAQKYESLRGRPVARHILRQIIDASKQATIQGQPPPVLVVICGGDDPSVSKYVQLKKDLAERVGIKCVVRDVSTCSEQDVINLIHHLNADPDVHGCMVQFPLPPAIDKDRLMRHIAESKDIEGYRGGNNVSHSIAVGVLETIAFYSKTLQGKRVAIVGQGNLICQSFIETLQRAAASVTHYPRIGPELRGLETDILITELLDYDATTTGIALNSLDITADEITKLDLDGILSEITVTEGIIDLTFMYDRPGFKPRGGAIDTLRCTAGSTWRAVVPDGIHPVIFPVMMRNLRERSTLKVASRVAIEPVAN